MVKERSVRERKPLVEIPNMQLSGDGPSFLVAQLEDSYRDALDTQRLPALRFENTAPS